MKKIILFLLFLITFQVYSAVYLKVIYIADHKADCSLKKCYLTRDTPADTYQLFDKEIEGFNYQEGYEYCILMEIKTPGVSEPAVPFDSTQVRYVLSEIKSKTKTGNNDNDNKKSSAIPDSSKWMLYKLRMKDGSTKTFSIQKAYIQFDVEKNTITGNTECNALSAAFTEEADSIKFENIVTTKMGCSKHSIEPVFLNMLNTTTGFKITAKQLYLFKGKVLVGLFTRKK